MTYVDETSIEDDDMTFNRVNMTSSAVTDDWSGVNDTLDILGNLTFNDTVVDWNRKWRASLTFYLACAAVVYFILSCIPLLLAMYYTAHGFVGPPPFHASFLLAQALALVAMMVGFHPPTFCTEIIRASLLLTSINVSMFTGLELLICTHIRTYRPSTYAKLTTSPWIVISIKITWIASVLLGHVHYLVTVVVGDHYEEDFCNRAASRMGIPFSISSAIALVSTIANFVIYASICRYPNEENPRVLEQCIAEQIDNNNSNTADVEDGQVNDQMMLSVQKEQRHQERLVRERIACRIVLYILVWMPYLVCMECVSYTIGFGDFVVDVDQVIITATEYFMFLGIFCILC